MKVLFKRGAIIGNIIFYIGLALITLLLLSSMKDNNKIPKFAGNMFFTVLSGSMEPNILPGDLVVVREIDEDSIKVGDIITYRIENSIVTHRVKEVLNNNNYKSFITKGDANNIQDDMEIRKENILGKVSFTIKNGGKVISFIKKNLMIIIIGILGVYVLTNIIGNGIKKKIYN